MIRTLFRRVVAVATDHQLQVRTSQVAGTASSASQSPASLQPLTSEELQLVAGGDPNSADPNPKGGWTPPVTGG